MNSLQAPFIKFIWIVCRYRHISVWMVSWNNWLYPRHTKYVGVYSFRFSVRLFVRLFVRSVGRHRVKVFALKFIRPHILKTLWWISFIFGMMVDIGRKFLSALSPPRGWPWGQGHGLRIFIKKFFCVLYSYIIKTLEEFHLYLTFC